MSKSKETRALVEHFFLSFGHNNVQLSAIAIAIARFTSQSTTTCMKIGEAHETQNKTEHQINTINAACINA